VGHLPNPWHLKLPDKGSTEYGDVNPPLISIVPDTKWSRSDRQRIAMLTRSMMEILAEASAGVEIPSSDVDEGRVSKVGVPGTSSEVGPRFLIRVHSSTSKPGTDEAFTAVRYRNYWFWVDDRDLSSKRGLGFLMILFTLVESGTTAAPPVLSITKP